MSSEINQFVVINFLELGSQKSKNWAYCKVLNLILQNRIPQHFWLCRPAGEGKGMVLHEGWARTPVAHANEAHVPTLTLP